MKVTYSYATTNCFIFCPVKYEAIEHILRKKDYKIQIFKMNFTIDFYNSIISKGYPVNPDVNIACVKIYHTNVN